MSMSSPRDGPIASNEFGRVLAALKITYHTDWRDFKLMTETYADQASSVEELVAEQQGESDTLSLDERFEILKNERRRIVLQYLMEADETVRLNDLTDQVTAIENDTTIDVITSEERKRVYVGLYQFHLPKMAKMGVIDYNKDRGDIALTDTGSDLYQECSSENGVRGNWQTLRLIIGLTGVGSVIGSILLQVWLVSTALLAVQTVLLGALWWGQSSEP